MTNYEKIITSSLEQMANLILSNKVIYACAFCCHKKHCNNKLNCKSGILKFLESEVKE